MAAEIPAGPPHDNDIGSIDNGGGAMRDMIGCVHGRSPGHGRHGEGCAVCWARGCSGCVWLRLFWLDGFQRMTFFSAMETAKNRTTASVQAAPPLVEQRRAEVISCLDDQCAKP